MTTRTARRLGWTAVMVTGHEHEATPFTACVREAGEDQVRRGVATVSQTAVLVKLFGCQGGAM